MPVSKEFANLMVDMAPECAPPGIGCGPPGRLKSRDKKTLIRPRRTGASLPACVRTARRLLWLAAIRHRSGTTMINATGIASLPSDWTRDAVRAVRGPLSAGLKREVLRTQASLYLRSVWGARGKEARSRVLNFDVTGFSQPTLRFLFREIFIDLDYYFETSNRSPFILDCGSNIGMSILFFKALYPGASVIGFEPASETYRLLLQNIDRNRLADVHVHPVALGETDATTDFFDANHPGSFVASTNRHRISEKHTTVKQVRLSTFIDRDVDFLKLDVEGAELSVLRDLAASGCIRRIAQMVVEYHHHIDTTEDRFAEFLAVLEAQRFGYQLKALANPRRRRGEFQDFLIYAYRKDRS